MHSVVKFWNLVLWGIVEGGLKEVKNLHAQLSHKQILKEMDFSVPDAAIRVAGKTQKVYMTCLYHVPRQHLLLPVVKAVLEHWCDLKVHMFQLGA